MNNVKEEVGEIPMVDPKPVLGPIRSEIKFCENHWNEVMFSLIDAGLESHIAGTEQEFHDAMVENRRDAALEVSTLITSQAIQSFGAMGVLRAGGCPICAFAGVTGHIIHQILPKYTTKTEV